MPIDYIYLGAIANDDTGDPLRTGGEIINDNFAIVAITGSNTFTDDQFVSGAINISGSVYLPTVQSFDSLWRVLVADEYTGEIYYRSASTLTGSDAGHTIYDQYDYAMPQTTKLKFIRLNVNSGSGETIVTRPSDTLMQETMPSNPYEGDEWTDTTTFKSYKYYDGYWVEYLPGIPLPATGSYTGSLDGTASYAISASWAPSSGHIIENSGSPVIVRSTLDFTNGLQAYDLNGKTTVTIGGSASADIYIDWNNGSSYFLIDPLTNLGVGGFDIYLEDNSRYVELYLDIDYGYFAVQSGSHYSELLINKNGIVSSDSSIGFEVRRAFSDINFKGGYYQSNFTSSFVSESFPSVRYVNDRIGGRLVSSSIKNPLPINDGHSIVWNSSSLEYILSANPGGSKWTGSATISREGDVDVTGSFRVSGSLYASEAVTTYLTRTTPTYTTAAHFTVASGDNEGRAFMYLTNQRTSIGYSEVFLSTGRTGGQPGGTTILSSSTILQLDASYVAIGTAGNTYGETSKFSVRGNGTTTGTTFAVKNSAGTVRFTILDNGTQNITGSVFMSGSKTMNGQLIVTGSQIISGSSGSIPLQVQGSGSIVPIFRVAGSQGELFSVTDELTGSLYSVNDISGLPILEVFSDNKVLLGSHQAPALFTTVRFITAIGSNIIYNSMITSSYDGMFVEYTATSQSNMRAGSIMAIRSASSVNYTEATTVDFGSTTGLQFMVMVTGSGMILTGSSDTTGWVIKALIKGL